MRPIKESSYDREDHRVSHAWSSPVSRRYLGKSGRCGTFVKYIKLYCQHSSLVGFKYISADQRSWVERILWILVYVFATSTLIFVVNGAFLEFTASPIITTVGGRNYPTKKLEFPGVAICSINRISHRSAVAMATELYSTNASHFSVEEILEMIRKLGDLYETMFMTDDQFSEIDRLLSKFYDGNYDVTEILKRLTPQCSLMLSECYFHGKKEECSNIFMFRKTQDGYCCTFNYATQRDIDLNNQESGTPVEVHKVVNLGVEFGLSVVLEPFLNDYFYSFLPIAGWKVTIFNPRDYPDMTSGGVTEILVSPRTQRNVEISAVRLIGMKNIMSYPVEKRGCIFPREMVLMGDRYSYSNCIVDCKTADIWKACNCKPFYYPRRSKGQYENSDSTRICSVMDIPCLAQHKSKWYPVVPHEGHNFDGKFVNRTWGLHCYNCYPSCEDVSYLAKTSVSIMKSGILRGAVPKDIYVVNQSVVNIYFTKKHTSALKQDELFRWYEILADISGICGVFVGFSLISVVELVYFIALFLHELWRGPVEDQTASQNDIQSKSSPIQTISSVELGPRTRLDMIAERRPRNRDTHLKDIIDEWSD